MDWLNGQDRRAWLDRQGENALAALQYYAGPGVNVNALAQIADMFNPVADIGRAGTAARGVVRPGATVSERVGALGNVATDMASVLAPVAGAAYADDAARGLVEGLANWSMPADDAVTRLVTDESGALYYRGSKGPEAGWSPNVHEAGAAYYYTDDLKEAQKYGQHIQKVDIPGLILSEDAELDPEFVYDLLENLEVRGFAPSWRGNPTTNGRFLQELGPSLADDFVERNRIINEALTNMGYSGRGYTEASGANSVAVWDEAAVVPVSPAEAQAQEILDLLASGRASEVTDDMMAAADPQYLYRNYDLPMDEASRMARAREMGLTSKALHGSDVDLRAFDTFRPGGSPGVYTTGDPTIADVYARRRYDMDKSGAPNYVPVMQDPRKTQKMARGGDYRVTYEPNSVRSRFARFDPRLAHLRNLSAGVGGLGIAAGTQSEQERSDDISAILAKYGV